MIESLITSKTRIKLLLKFFLNSQTMSYLRSLETEFGESTNSIRIELNKMESAGLLLSTSEGNKKLFFANTNHPLFDDINNIVKKYVGIDQIIEQFISKIGNLDAAFLTGDIARGKDSKIIELALIGRDFDLKYIAELVVKAESLLSRQIVSKILTRDELIKLYSKKSILLLFSNDNYVSK